MLRTVGLTKRFGAITAVDGLDLEVRAGEVFGFLGPHGSGKSTTAGMILGLIKPSDGQVELFGRALVVTLWVTLVVVVGFVAALLASVLFSSLEGLGTGVGRGFIPGSLAAIARTAFMMLPYATLSFLVAVWTRSTAAGIAIGLSVLFIEGLGVSLFRLLPVPFNEIPNALISQNVQAVVRANALDRDTFAGADTNLPPVWRAAVVLTAYIAAFVVLSYRRFLTRDVTSA